MHEKENFVIELETQISRFESLEEIARACILALLKAGRIDRVQMLLMSLSVQAKGSARHKSIRTPAQRKEIYLRTQQLLKESQMELNGHGKYSTGLQTGGGSDESYSRAAE